MKTLWPVPLRYWEQEDVIHIDGVHLGKDAVVVIAMTKQQVIGWHIGVSETKEVWLALLRKIQAPKVAVVDGSRGLANAIKEVWPETEVQMCLVHIRRSVEHVTGHKPVLMMHKEILYSASRLHSVRTLQDAEQWEESFNTWCEKWDPILEGKSPGELDNERKKRGKTLRIRNMFRRHIKSGTLFTFLRNSVPDIPSTNNIIENLNGRIRKMLGTHKGITLETQLQHICWYCFNRTKKQVPNGELPMPVEDILAITPTEQQLMEAAMSENDVNRLYTTAVQLIKIRAKQERKEREKQAEQQTRQAKKTRP